jgi:MYXO-CTERM domain-containing protein
VVARRARARLIGYSAAAVALVTLCVVMLWPSSAQLEYAVRGGPVGTGNMGAGWVVTASELATLDFTDGSAVLLSPDTALNVNALGPRSALTRLARGSVRVAVEHHDDTRWTFLAGPYEVRVEGTTFELSWQRERFELSMHEGRGQWSTVCEGEIGPSPEICDGIDSNCDGIGDVDCECINGTTEVCGGPDVGQCKSGLKTCSDGHWSACVGAVGPSQEICDCIDNDCDGLIDEPILSSDDDVPHGLCRIDQICDNCACLDTQPMQPQPDAGTGGGGAVPGGDASGCACRAGGAGAPGTPAAGLLGLALIVGLVVRRRRR